MALGEQRWRSGESTCLPRMWPKFKSWRRRHMWVEFVVGTLPCSERFFSGYTAEFSPLLQNQHFQIPIRSGTHGHVSTSSYELLSAPWVNKLQFTIQIIHNQPNFAIYKTSISTYLSMVCWRPAFFSFSVLTALRRASNDLLETTSSKVSSIMSWRNFLCRLNYSFIKVTYM